MEEFCTINWFYKHFEKPQFNWYQKNDTYFEDIKKWKNMEKYLLIYYHSKFVI